MGLPHYGLLRHRQMRTLAVGLAAGFTLVDPAPAEAASACTKVASPTGSDLAPGTPDEPFRTAQKLAYSLRAGDVGCLRAGTYNENVELTEAGSASAPVTFQSYPGERARIVGELAVRAGADHTTVAELDLNGRNSGSYPSPAVSADHVTFESNDITNDHTAICFLLGTATRARFTVIRNNRIHDCGRMPATNLEHGIYVQATDDTQILDNLIYDNADFGIQLYPDAQRTLVKGNVIDANGMGLIFSGDHGKVANDNVVEDNVITNSRDRWNVEYYYDPGEPIGQGNVVRRNCVHGGANGDSGGGISRQVGFTASDNVTADPLYVDRAAKNFELQAQSPCRHFTPPEVPAEADPTAPQAEREAVARSDGGARLTVRLSAPGRRYVAALGKVKGSASGTVELTAYHAPRGKRFRLVRSRSAAVRGGRFKQKLAPFRRGRWRLEGRLKGTPSAVDAGQARLEDEGASGGAKGEVPPVTDLDGRRSLESSGTADAGGGARTSFGTAQFDEVTPPGPLARGGYVSRGSQARPELVARIQNRLSLAGLTTPADGTFGPRTEAAIRHFQRTHGLVVDGIVGRQTMAGLKDYRL